MIKLITKHTNFKKPIKMFYFSSTTKKLEPNLIKSHNFKCFNFYILYSFYFLLFS